MVPDLAAAGGVGTAGNGEPGLGGVALFEVVGGGGPPIRVGTQPGSTAWLITSGQRRARARASAVTNSLLSQ